MAMLGEDFVFPLPDGANRDSREGNESWLTFSFHLDIVATPPGLLLVKSNMIRALLRAPNMELIELYQPRHSLSKQ